ncbi:MAG: phospho-N-acetylmuramoyl-pentapeptide-transferase [Propionibacteriaceae bacterium]|jgi:phospho-N-acetylmuramoyl-pentapeptide-transferase|nr:phospho-N-acetylmuramoyl-pentapeptide-transferase [Propionibacteriaceae bacterium]
MKTVVGAGVIALLVALIGTRFWIEFLVKRQYGQFVRSDGPQSHAVKRGTPTMGGVVIIVAVVLAYAISHLVTKAKPSASGLLLLGLMLGTGFLGFLDDWAKISKQRSLGLSPRAKLIGQTILGVSFGYLSFQFPDERGVTPASQYVSFLRDISWVKLPIILAIIWMTFLITAYSNAVNLTDGLDGLATGASGAVFAAYSLVCIWQRNQWCGAQIEVQQLCYEVRNPQDLAGISVALAGACFGFLWWNARPAKIFMGDTGSLALGAAMAGMAIFSRTELLLTIMGVLFVVETASSAIQVAYFKLTHGKRFFKMAPIHHHFELLGWDEITVVIRFWIVSGVAAAGAFGLFYAEWVVGQ